MSLRWLAFALSAAACAGKSPYSPGTPLGTYHVTGALSQQTCGGQLPSPWEFDIKLNQEGRTIYWIQGSVPVAATLSATNLASFSSTAEITVRDADRTRGACVVRRDDALAAQFPAGIDLGSFGGSLSYSYTPREGADCLDQLGATFAALPCVVAYSVTATRTQSPDGGK